MERERQRQRQRQRDRDRYRDREECVWGGGWSGVRFVVESIVHLLIVMSI